MLRIASTSTVLSGTANQRFILVRKSQANSLERKLAPKKLRSARLRSILKPKANIKTKNNRTIKMFSKRSDKFGVTVSIWPFFDYVILDGNRFVFLSKIF